MQKFRQPCLKVYGISKFKKGNNSHNQNQNEFKRPNNGLGSESAAAVLTEVGHEATECETKNAKEHITP